MSCVSAPTQNIPIPTATGGSSNGVVTSNGSSAPGLAGGDLANHLATPPRSALVEARTRSQTVMRSKDSLQLLMGMGFPKNRAEKALVATGDSGVQVAADWLLSHVFDPELDKQSPMEFIVYACPLGVLGNQIEEFMEKALYSYGRNGAHKSSAHVTLCQFFKCEDSLVPHVIHILNKCVQSALSSTPKEIKLKRYVAQGYIGLFLEEEAASWFRDIMADFSSEAKAQFGVTVKPHKLKLHVTMAHQYSLEHHDKLEDLARSKVDPQSPCKWEMRLYCRDHRLGHSEVYKVLFPYSAQKDDELDLVNGDYVFVSDTDQGRTDNEGWFFGTSFNNGMSGLYPGNYVEKVKDSDCWTDYKSWSLLIKEGNTKALPSSPVKKMAHAPPVKQPASRQEDQQLYTDATGLLPDQKNVEALYSKVHKRKLSKDRMFVTNGSGGGSGGSSHHEKNGELEDSVSMPSSSSHVMAGPRRLFICRHAERVDVTFGKQWISLSFDTNGYYTRRNLNMPKSVPKRLGGASVYTSDSPVTEIGLFQARLTGEGMREQGIRVSHVFCSPALRCVQTADAILKGLNDSTVKIKIENGLFEWLAWCRDGFPTFMSREEVLDFGINIDVAYTSQVALSDLKPNETHLEFYKRMFNITRLLLKTVGSNGGCVMFVGHAATLEACTRQLVGAQPRSAQELTKIVQKIPYCGMCVCQESNSGRSSTWDFIDPPIPPLTHAPNIRFDWRCLQ